MNIFKKLKNYFTFTDSQTMYQEDTNEEQKVNKEEKEKEYIFCPECNAMNSDYRTHCIRCGYYLKGMDTTKQEDYILSEYERIATLINCNYKNCKAIESLAIETYVYVTTKKDDTNYLAHNRATVIETTIFTCFFLTVSSFYKIGSVYNRDLFVNEYLDLIAKILFSDFNIESSFLTELINNRYDLYNKSNQTTNSSEEFIKSLLFNFRINLIESYCNDTNKIMTTESPITIIGALEMFQCQMEILEYFNSLDDIFKPTLDKVIYIYDNIHL